MLPSDILLQEYHMQKKSATARRWIDSARFFVYHAHMEKNLRPVVTVRIFAEEKCFGPGIAILLSQVRQTRSLRAAAMSIGMAYSKAWTIIKNAEAGLGFKLLDSTTGGKHGGGATLTPQAEAILPAYESYCAALRGYAAQLFTEKFSCILHDADTPDAGSADAPDVSP